MKTVWQFWELRKFPKIIRKLVSSVVIRLENKTHTFLYGQYALKKIEKFPSI